MGKGRFKNTFFNSGLGSRLAVQLYHLFQDENGQGTVEYLLILSATVVGASALVKSILNTLDRGVLRLGSTLEKDLKTGF